MSARPRIGVLGSGNMAAALLRGWLGAGWTPLLLSCSSSDGAGAAALAGQLGVACGTNREVAESAEVLVLAVKPRHAAAALSGCAGSSPPTLLLSVAAGLRAAWIDNALPWGRQVETARAMPNLAVATGAGALAFCAPQQMAAGNRRLLESCLAPLGEAMEIPEQGMDAATAVLGSGPAYLLSFVHALALAARRQGLASQTSERMAHAALRGAADMATVEAEASVQELVRRVAAPGGTTEAALEVLRDGGMPGLLEQAVAAATKRGGELGHQGGGEG